MSTPTPATARTEKRRTRTLPVTSTHVFALVLVAALLFHRSLTSFVESSATLSTAATVFAGVFVQAVPFLVLGVLLSGAIATFVSPALIARVLPRNPVASVAVAGLAGAALPGCECGSVPVSRRLIDRGAPSASALAFMLSAPAINPVVLVATAIAFPGEPGMVVGRFVASLLVAWIVGWWWARFGGPQWITRTFGSGHHDGHGHGGDSRWATFTEAARHDLLQAGSFLVMGAAFAAALHVLVPPAVYDHLAGNMILAILVMAVLAVALALCSEADAFVASALSMLPLLPRLVFLVVGPAVDVKLIAMQTGSFGRTFAVRFAPVTFVVAVLVGSAVGYVALGGAR